MKALELLTRHQTAKLELNTGSKKKLRPPQFITDENALANGLKHLEAYGYFPKKLMTWKDITIADILKAIGLYQKWFGETQTGGMDIGTLASMAKPRCVHADFLRKGVTENDNRLVAFAKANLNKWTKKGLTYRVDKYLKNFTKIEQDEMLAVSFNSWTQHSNGLEVKLAGAGQTPDILIGSGSGASLNFDGPSGVLAWAYLPDQSDRQLVMMFDEAEAWVKKLSRNNQILYVNVATHEIGHLLGLTHSNVQSALMAPYYSPSIAVPQKNDDIPRYVGRYPINPNKPVTPTPSPVPPQVPGEVDFRINIKGNKIEFSHNGEVVWNLGT